MEIAGHSQFATAKRYLHSRSGRAAVKLLEDTEE